MSEEGAGLLRNAISTLGRISEEEWHTFSCIWTEIDIPRKVNVTNAGEIERHVYFVLDGIQRLYSISEDGKESTLVFTYAGDFGGVLDSYLLQIPSRYYYETLSKSRMLKSEYADFQSVLRKCPRIKNAVDRGIYLAFSGTMTRLTELQSLNSEEKFKKLLKRTPHIIHKIPHKYLANYIGIDPTNFSKLYNSIRIEL